MKRRVLRSHANKRCLRILSASNQLRQTSSSSDRSYAVLCDASFLRAVLLSYWQAHAPTSWKDARKRHLRKVASATAQPQRQPRPSSSPSTLSKPQTEQESSANHNTSDRKLHDREASSGVFNANQIRLSDTWSTTATTIARLPVQLPSHSPDEFLNALMCDAVQVEDGNGKEGEADSNNCEEENKTKASKPNHPTHKKNSGAAPFLYHCLPETIAALHRMRETTNTAKPSYAATEDDGKTQKMGESVVAAAREDASLPRKQQRDAEGLVIRSDVNATERWLAASFRDGGNKKNSSSIGGHYGATIHSKGQGRSPRGAVAPLTFQEIPAVVVDALLSRFRLLQYPQAAASSESKGNGSSMNKKDSTGNKTENGKEREKDDDAPSRPSHQPQLQGRNEAKAIADFMAFNQYCVEHSGNASAVLSAGERFGFTRVRLCNTPCFTDVAAAASAGPLGYHALKRLRKSKRNQSEAANAAGALRQDSQEDAHRKGERDGGSSKPFRPRFFFVATQSHDVRKRLAPVTALLRLTTNPDALWIEQRGTAYHYNTDHNNEGERSSSRGAVATNRKRAPASCHATSFEKQSHRHKMQRQNPTASSSTASSAPTVVSAAPQLSRADVAFMKHLGTATHISLPEKASSLQLSGPISLQHSVRATETGDTGKATPERGSLQLPGRKRSRQKGQNPLSMKKKRKREVFRV